MPALIAAQQLLPRPADPPVEIGDRLALRDRMGDRIAPETRQRGRFGGADLGDGAALPDTEAQLAKAAVDGQGPVQLLAQFTGESGAAAQRRADHGLPVAAGAHRRPHLPPAERAQGIVDRAPEFLPPFRLAVPQ